MKLLPIYPGFVKIGGIGFADTTSQLRFEFDNLMDVFVVRNEM